MFHVMTADKSTDLQGQINAALVLVSIASVTSHFLIGQSG